MSETFVQQPDGRMVAGPALPTLPAPRVPSRFAIAALAALAFAAGLVAGLTTPREGSTIHEQLVGRLEQGCVVIHKAVTTNDSGRAALDRDAAEARAILEASGASRIETTLGEANDAMRRLDPTATYFGLMSWETCA